MKIAVMGYSGSGKSTLASFFAKKEELPLLHLDQVNFVDNWQEREGAASKEIVEQFLTQKNWVIDGNYRRFSHDQRLADADKIYLLLFSRWRCLMRVLKRTMIYFRKNRPDMAANCPERLDGDFLLWILYYGRSKEKQASFQKISEQYADKVVIIRNQKELDKVYQQQKT